MTTTYVIPQKLSAGSIHDIASSHYDRDIVFAAGCKNAAVLASDYGGYGYSTHRTAAAAIAASRRKIAYRHCIIDIEGTKYADCGDHLATWQDGRWVHNYIPGTKGATGA